MSQAITLGVLSAVMLTAGCGRSSTARSGRVFYDANRNPVPRNLWVGADGRPVRLYDANGNPVPENEVLAAYNAGGSSSGRAGGYSSYRRYGGWGPSFYTPGPSYAWGPTYGRPAPSSSSPSAPGRTYFGGSRPGTSPAPTFGSKSGGSSSSSGSSSSGGSVSRGGFGGGGAHASGGSSS